MSTLRKYRLIPFTEEDEPKKKLLDKAKRKLQTDNDGYVLWDGVRGSLLADLVDFMLTPHGRNEPKDYKVFENVLNWKST